MKKRNIINAALLAGTLILSSCTNDMLDVDSQPTISQTQFESLIADYPERSYSILSGIENGNNRFMIDFGTLGNFHDDFGYKGYLLGLDFMSNDLSMTKSNWFSGYYGYTARNESSVRTRAVWAFFYKSIYNVNQGLSLLETASGNGTLDDKQKHIKARYLAMRADGYFNLIRIYANGDQGVPYLTEKEKRFERVSTAEIKTLIEADLLQAYSLIQGYSRSSKEILDKNVIAGLLARYYQETKNCAKASEYAQLAYAGYAPMNTTQLEDGFNKISNTEWMWGADINTETSNYYASFFSNMGNLNAGYAGLLQSYKTIDKRLFDQIPATDARKEWFVDTGNPYGLPKYANIKFYDDTDFEGDYVFMRAAEMYLIDAEAKAHLNPAAGKTALDAFVQTRNPSFSAPTTQAELLKEIYFQRAIELWGEGGFAFFDMKRLGNGLLRQYPGSNHVVNQLNYPANSTKFTFQIPLIEINNNEANISQNPN